MIPFLIALTIWTAAFVAVGVTYEVKRGDPEPNTKPIYYSTPHHKEQAP